MINRSVWPVPRAPDASRVVGKDLREGASMRPAQSCSQQGLTREGSLLADPLSLSAPLSITHLSFFPSSLMVLPPFLPL